MENWQLAFSTFHNFLPSLRKHVPTCQEHAAAEAESRENLTSIDKVERALLIGSMSQLKPQLSSFYKFFLIDFILDHNTLRLPILILQANAGYGALWQQYN